jgi:hypothetical protein
MRIPMTGIGLLLCVGIAVAQEQVPQERAQKAAQLLAEQSGKLTDLPLKIDPDTEKPFGLHHGDVAALVIPAKGLSAEALAKAGKSIMPLGQLWFRRMTPIVAGTPTPNNKLRLVKISVDGQEHEVSLYLLGLRSKEKAEPELVIYAQGKEPLVALPLEKIDGRQEQPIELEGQKGDDGTGTLTLNVAGRYRARLTVAPLQP